MSAASTAAGTATRPAEPTLDALLRYFLFLGTVGFGGPVALVGQMVAHRISVHRGGRSLVAVPLLVGLTAALWAPRLTILAGLAALVVDCTLSLERSEDAT